MAKKATKKAKTKVKSVTAKIMPGSISTIEPTYSNFAQVRVGPADTTPIFCQVVAPDESDMPAVRKKGYVDAESKSVIIMPTIIAQALVQAMRSTIPDAEEE